MPDTSVKKVSSQHSPKGKMGQRYLVMGKRMSMRLWEEEPSDQKQGPHAREYETVGYVVHGKAELHLEDQKVILAEGDSWVVPSGARHHYQILEPFLAVEATSPPAEVHGRDER